MIGNRSRDPGSGFRFRLSLTLSRDVRVSHVTQDLGLGFKTWGSKRQKFQYFMFSTVMAAKLLNNSITSKYLPLSRES